MPIELDTSSPSAALKAPVLNSWKEIASYMGRGIRTVQRYERDFHLPVRRLPGKARGAVLAIPQDLDAWLRYAPVKGNDSEPQVRTAAVVTAAHDSIGESTELRFQSRALRNAHHDAVTRLHQTLRAILMNISSSKPNA